ncbi:hypothetical protein LWC34_48290 [Kibdelosporangium philippinense]|uniref:Uncharacterized protein n=1 Tax=Kibdelosporangium philippinense TaxID=211113 RepID=A0ABS8ZS34_9PSEU|nr:hypothetical protein [Kibdelosporangium philippinense]MCE7010553.1 hypothetical protein [Kibdelosporangium philippinense]
MSFTERYSRPLPATLVDGWTIKPYQVAIRQEPIATSTTAAADEFLRKLLPDSLTHPSLVHEQASSPKYAFAVLHQGADALWLNLYVWVYQAILHVRAASSTLDTVEFSELTEPLIGCVWELPALVHERSAWVRHVMTPDSPDLDAYLADVLPAGPVGGP